MLILPAIDIRGGNCVRLYQGRQDRETVYSNDPVDVAQVWKMKGAKMLHIADLDGAFQGRPIHLDLIARLRQTVGLPVQVGGGFRDYASIAAAIKAGIDRVILGTVAVYNTDLVLKVVSEFGPAISVSIDVSNDFVTVAGWTEVSTVRFDDLATRMREMGIAELLFTDTKRDGTLTGPNVGAIRLFLKVAKVPVIVSGGITTQEDVVSLKLLEPEGLKGVVIGKALYDHKIKFEDVLRIGG